MRLFALVVCLSTLVSSCAWIGDDIDTGVPLVKPGPGFRIPADTLYGAAGRVIDVEFVPKQNRLVSLAATGSESSVISFFHAPSGKLENTMENDRFLDLDTGFSNDGRKWAIGSRTVFLLNTEDKRIIRVFESDSYQHQKLLDIDMTVAWPFGIRNYEVMKKYHYVTALAFSRDDRYMASGHVNCQVRVWEIRSGKLLLTLWLSKIHEAVSDLEFSPDGRFIAATQNDSKIYFWEFPSGKERHIEGHGKSVNAVSFDPSGRWLASGSDDRTVRLWDTGTGDLLRVFTGHEDDVLSTAFTSNGEYIASAGRDGKIKIWEARSGYEIVTLAGHSAQVNSISFNSNASLLASGSDDMTVVIWDISRFDLVRDSSAIPMAVYPARIRGKVEVDDESGDGRFSPMEKGSLSVTVENTGEEAAYRVVMMILPSGDTSDFITGDSDVIEMILPGKSVTSVIPVIRTESPANGDEAGFELRCYEFNGFHLQEPVRFSIPRARE
ncbi:MAG: WD40 repeat domain-containing protein [Candidatus Krumholzibacteriota bacterium]|nr:WD40 repeat domain-containing protein [Candidatus Krumholzibacteriota bacterium]